LCPDPRQKRLDVVRLSAGSFGLAALSPFSCISLAALFARNPQRNFYAERVSSDFAIRLAFSHKSRSSP
jgi:hypothetical protein